MYIMELTLNMYQSIGLSAVFYYVGVWIRKWVPVLTKYCVPAPAVGGIAFLIISGVLHGFGILTISFDTTFQNLLLWTFFASVGMGSKPKMLGKVGKKFIYVFVACAILILVQNIASVGIMTLFGKQPLIGMCVGSLPMVGGHATSGAWADTLESAGVTGALTISLAAATFGVLAGGTLGGPTARKLITKYNLAEEINESGVQVLEETATTGFIDNARFMKAAGLMVFCLIPGELLSNFLSSHGFILPASIGSLIFGCIIGMIFDEAHIDLPEEELNALGGCCLGLYLTLAMMSIKVWQLSGLAVPFILVLILEALLTVAFAYFVIFRVAGRDYEAAVMAAGVIGFGLGATPNALANMNTLKSRYGAAPQAYIIIPLLGTMFIDIVLSLINTGFVNFIA